MSPFEPPSAVLKLSYGFFFFDYIDMGIHRNSSLGCASFPPSAEMKNVRARACDPFEKGAGFIGGSNDGAGETARIRALGQRGLPPYPGHETVPAIVIPSPALLDTDLSAIDQVRFLAACYRGAIKATFHKDSWLMLRGDPRKKEALYEQLRKFALGVAEAQIPPASWCLFSADAWRFQQISKKPPSTKWVFSCKRLETQLEWYEFEKPRWVGRRNIVAQSHLELLADWQAMWRDLLRKKPPDRLSVLAIVEQHFPGETFEHSVEKARGEVFRRQQAVDRKIAAGVIQWTA